MAVSQKWRYIASGLNFLDRTDTRIDKDQALVRVHRSYKGLTSLFLNTRLCTFMISFVVPSGSIICCVSIMFSVTVTSTSLPS